VPGGQSVQALALPVEYFPMSHGEQGARPRAPYCPGPHGTRSLLYQATFTPFMAELKTSKAPSPAGTTRATGEAMSRMTRARTGQSACQVTHQWATTTTVTRKLRLSAQPKHCGDSSPLAGSSPATPRVFGRLHVLLKGDHKGHMHAVCVGRGWQGGAAGHTKWRLCVLSRSLTLAARCTLGAGLGECWAVLAWMPPRPLCERLWVRGCPD
jgi:hypothetical protein